MKVLAFASFENMSSGLGMRSCCAKVAWFNFLKSKHSLRDPSFFKTGRRGVAYDEMGCSITPIIIILTVKFWWLLHMKREAILLGFDLCVFGQCNHVCCLIRLPRNVHQNV